MADRYRIRVLAIRRPGGAVSTRRCFAVHSGRDEQWIQRLDLEQLDELADVDLSPLHEARPLARGLRWDEPVYLVCTHGEHDRCCRRYGRAVADALLADRPEHAWECSHVGGDRFAANLVCLPHGLYFGRVPPDRAGDIARLYEEGKIELEHFRGRSSHEPAVQVAEILIRLRERIDGLDDLTFAARADHGGGESTLAFTDSLGVRHDIRIAIRRGAPRRITCEATKPGAPREYRPVFVTS